MNWKEIPECPPVRPIFSPKDAKEAQDIFNIYKLQKAIYTDFKRVNKSMFYRKNGNELLHFSLLGLNFDSIYSKPVEKFVY